MRADASYPGVDVTTDFGRLPARRTGHTLGGMERNGITTSTGPAGLDPASTGPHSASAAGRVAGAWPGPGAGRAGDRREMGSGVGAGRGGLAMAGFTAGLVGLVGLVGATIAGEVAGASPPSSGLLAVDIVIGLLTCAALLPMRRWPVPTSVLLAALAAVSPAATPAATIGTLQTARARPFRPALAVALAGVAGHLIRGGWRPLPGLPYGWWLLLVLVAHAALLGWGALARARAALIDSLGERARRAET
ncbi:MAG: hypothetical protein V7637_6707, partial [Mycobacteriales bacterium]